MRLLRNRNKNATTAYNIKTRLLALTGASILAATGIVGLTQTAAHAIWDPNNTAGQSVSGSPGLREIFALEDASHNLGYEVYAWCALEYPYAGATQYSGAYEWDSPNSWTPVTTDNDDNLVNLPAITGSDLQAVAYINAMVLHDTPGGSVSDSRTELFKGTIDWASGTLLETDPFFIANETEIRDLWAEAQASHGPYYVDPALTIFSDGSGGMASNIAPYTVHSDTKYGHTTMVTVTVTGRDAYFDTPTNPTIPNVKTFVWTPEDPLSENVTFNIPASHATSTDLVEFDIDFVDLPNHEIIVLQGTNDATFIDPSSSGATLDRAQNLFVLGSFIPLAGSVVDGEDGVELGIQIVTELNKSTTGELTANQPLEDHITVTQIGTNAGAWAGDLPINAEVVFYGPIVTPPSAQQGTVPAGTPEFSRVPLVITPDQTEYDVQSEDGVGQPLPVTQPGAYTAVVHIDYSQQSSGVQALFGVQEFNTPYFEPTETGYLKFSPRIETSILGNEKVVAHGVDFVTVTDEITLSAGFPENQGEFYGFNAEQAPGNGILPDYNRWEHRVYHVSNEIIDLDEDQDLVCVPGADQMQLRAVGQDTVTSTIPSPAGNLGESQYIDFDVIIGDREGTFVIVSEFQGDGRSNSFVSPCFNPEETFFVTRSGTVPPTVPPTAPPTVTPTTPPTTIPELPKTGSELTSATLVASGLLGSGFMLWAASRRRTIADLNL